MNRLDIIQRGIEKRPHIGPESEGILVDPRTCECIKRIDGNQPVQAIKEYIRSTLIECGDGTTNSIVPDVTELTVECNPDPLHSPLSAAAVQRLFSVLVDEACQGLSQGNQSLQLLHGAAWRPPGISSDDVSEDAELFKRLYYSYQVDRYRDKIAAAAGDHLNLSIPWCEEHPKTISEMIIKFAGRMRLIGGALSIALSASSPIFTSGNGFHEKAEFSTLITSYLSARLGLVWSNRVDMDESGLLRDEISHHSTMLRFADQMKILSGADLYIPVRAQPGEIPNIQPFSSLCENLDIDVSSEEGFKQAKDLLFSVFRNEAQFFTNSSDLEVVKKWHREKILGVINTPRNRVEIRTFETPFAFPDMTPYQYTKAVYTFFELLFIYLSENPSFTDKLVYDEGSLNSAKRNEELALLQGLDAVNTWIPEAKEKPLIEILKYLLSELDEMSKAFGRREDLEIIHRLANGELLSPAMRIRNEVGEHYSISTGGKTGYDRVLPNDDYPKMLLQRTRESMATELEQIESDLSSFPPKDREYIKRLLVLVKKMKKHRMSS